MQSSAKQLIIICQILAIITIKEIDGNDSLEKSSPELSSVKTANEMTNDRVMSRDDYNDPDLYDVLDEEKRGKWNNLQGGWGKRAEWKKLSAAWGKRADQRTPNKWNNLSGMWGKRADNQWNQLSGMWGKRDWKDMSSAWGKRDTANWNKLRGMWGKRSAEPETYLYPSSLYETK